MIAAVKALYFRIIHRCPIYWSILFACNFLIWLFKYQNEDGIMQFIWTMITGFMLIDAIYSKMKRKP